MARHRTPSQRNAARVRNSDPESHQERFLNSFSEVREVRRLQGPIRDITRCGKLEVAVKAPIPHYRFEGVMSDTGWCIADVSEAWPLIDELRSLCDDYERITHNRKTRTLRKRIADKVIHINFIAMRQTPLSSVAFENSHA